MKNFIKYNIEHVKGKPRAASLIDRQPRNYSPVKPQQRSQAYRSINDRVRDLESQVYDMHESKNESLILDEITEIKRDIKLIKSHLFGQRARIRNHSDEDEQNQSENIYTLAQKSRIKSFGSESDEHKTFQTQASNPKRVYKLQEILDQKIKRSESGYSKSSMALKNIYPMLKQYKLDGPEHGTIFYGYAKRNSQPVAIKYSSTKLNKIIEVYDRLWKNIAKAEWPCINRIYDYKTDENNIIVMEKNKSNIVGLPYQNILVDIVKILEFIHDCGYLYRNVEPEHFMLNQDGQLVVIDFKRATRYVDIRGHPVEVFDSIYTGSPFASNNQVRGVPESRKDDLESVGYLALLFFGMEIPWGGMNKEQVIRIRSSLTLQELFKGRPNWIQYMAYIFKLNKNQRPDYKYLCHLISQ